MFPARAPVNATAGSSLAPWRPKRRVGHEEYSCERHRRRYPFVTVRGAVTEESLDWQRVMEATALPFRHPSGWAVALMLRRRDHTNLLKQQQEAQALCDGPSYIHL